MLHRIGLYSLAVSTGLLIGPGTATAGLGAGPDRPIVRIVIGSPWDGNHPTILGLNAALVGFHQRYPHIRAEIAPGVGSDKFVVQVSAGTAPDLYINRQPEVLSWANRGLILPLSERLKASGIKQSDFYGPSLGLYSLGGELYALPFWVDGNFPLLRSKRLFAEAGLDPDRGPATLREFQEADRKLTRYEGDALAQIGMVAWDVYGNDNTVWSWGWVFGGHFIDEARLTITAHDPPIVEALEWLRDKHLRYSSGVAALQRAAPPGSQGLFRVGREAMRFDVPSAVLETLRANPTLDLGMSPMPMGADTGDNPAWFAGQSLFIPVASRHPDAAWQLLRYLTADPEGTSLFARASGWFPGYVRSPVYRDFFLRDPVLRSFIEVLEVARNHRPSIPVLNEFAGALAHAFVSSVVQKSVQPRDALQQVSTRIQAELDRFMTGP